MKCDSPRLKLAIAIALIRSKFLEKPSSSHSPSKSDALRWKRLAKKRKRELLTLKRQLNQLQDEMQYDLFPQSASCKCYFFDRCGKLSSSTDVDDRRINDVLRRRFLRLVRWTEKKKGLDNSVRPRHAIELNGNDEIELLSTSVDFLVELSSADSPVENNPSFAASSHQAIDLILASLKNLLSRKKESELIEGIVGSLIMRLVRRMCPPLEREGSTSFGSNVQLYVQHLIRQLGSEPYIGQRTMLLVSQRISVLADSLLFMDPFDDAFPDMHRSMFMMIQLIEFLLSDYLQTWAIGEGFESRLFEDWVRSVIQAQKALNLLENRNGLYILYMDRVIGELVKQLGPISQSGTLDMDILENLFTDT
ncbi:protein MULTIPOLAR SPINDLE 1 [Magnolia sinica]|uniref:protein MULTIPOLAR SPINDLE 1 n=1 Tax=Magnolia sinica TaxID=86752 RepID=UPI002659339D|nr:protein MULTIPOLAR SPINDLE 1 [Magnolia sinica]